jgi:uncharacterized protein YqhQ
MKEKAFDKVTAYIDALAQKLGVAAEHVYITLIRQQYVEGITSIIACLFAIGVTFYIAKKTTELTKNKREAAKEKWITSMSEDLAPVAVAVTWVLFFISLIVTMFVIPGSVSQLINPEYYAIKEILNSLK